MKNGPIVRIAKKGNLIKSTKCGDWKGITLMSVAAKVIGKVMFQRILDGDDAKLRTKRASLV